MSTLFLIFLLLLILGPLRRPYFGRARFTIPATIGLLVGLGIAAYVARAAGLPPLVAILLMLAIAGALSTSMGRASKEWLDRVFGPKEHRRD